MEDITNENSNSYTPDKGDQERTKIDKKLFLEYLEKSRGITSACCDKINIARATYYNWLKADKNFKKAVNSILYRKGEFLEERLYAQALAGDTKALIFLLPYLNRKYKKSSEISKKSDVHIHHYASPDDGLPSVTLQDIINDPILWERFQRYLKNNADNEEMRKKRSDPVKLDISAEQLKKFTEVYKEKSKEGEEILNELAKKLGLNVEEEKNSIG